MRILAGRAFERMHPDDVREAVIDEQLARHFFPTGTPIGAAIPFKGRRCESWAWSNRRA